MDSKKYIIRQTYSARKALRQLNDLGLSDAVLFVLNDTNQVIGTLTDGDIRRGLLKDLQIDESVIHFMNKQFHFFTDTNFKKQQLAELKKKRLSYVPFLNKNGQLNKILHIGQIKSILEVDVVIMAGGRGERLKPLTDKIPKPLLQVGNKPIIEHNIDRLIGYGANHFHITLRYLGDQIKRYLNSKKQNDITLNYYTEKKPLGTIGSLSIIKKFQFDNVLLMNSDLLTTINFDEFFERFISSNADMLVATIPYEISVPYAIMDLDQNNYVKGFSEKPKYIHYTNAGIYLIKRKWLKYIPNHSRFDATEFMDILIQKKHQILSYPIIDYWLDIGRMEDYIKAQSDIKHLTL